MKNIEEIWIREDKKVKEILIEFIRKKVKILSGKIGNMENRYREFSINKCVY